MEVWDPEIIRWYLPCQIWNLSCVMKTKSRLHINQKPNSSCNSKGSFDKKNVFFARNMIGLQKGKKANIFEGQKVDPSMPQILPIILHTYQSYLLFPCFSPSCQVGASTWAVGDLALQWLVSPSPSKYGYIWGGNWPAKKRRSSIIKVQLHKQHGK